MIKQLKDCKIRQPALRKTLYLFILFYSAVAFSQPPEFPDNAPDTLKLKSDSIEVGLEAIHPAAFDTLSAKPPPESEATKEMGGADDSFYQSLEKKAEKNKLFQILYNLIVVSPSTAPSAADTADFIKSEKEFHQYEGKIIASIQLKKVDILSGSVKDTLQIVETGFTRLLNTLHVTTRDRVVYNNLLFEEGDYLEPYALSDSERLLRELSFIQDAKIYLNPRPGNKNQVDVIVVTQDVFSIGATGSVKKADNFRVGVYDRNLLGTGNELRYSMLYNGALNPPTGHDIKFNISNFRGTFISGLLNYVNTAEIEMVRANFERGFISPQIKYTGGLDIGRSSEFREAEVPDPTFTTSFTRYYQDVWFGRSYRIGVIERRQNLILAGRISNDSFTERPVVTPDSNRFYHNNRLYLGSLSFQKIDYVKSTLILSFGSTEDVPIGYLFRFTGGYEDEEFARKPYVGMEAAAVGVWSKLGTMGGELTWGSFYNNGKWVESVFKVRGFLLAKLLAWKTYRFRHIFDINYISGIRRLPGEILNLKENLRGLSGEGGEGTRKLVANIESVVFTPWYLIGFRFAPYVFIDLGFITPDKNLISTDHFYGTVGFGFRVRNESLVLNPFQFRIGYFFRTPDGANRWNYDVSSRDSNLFNPVGVGKPDIIGFE